MSGVSVNNFRISSSLDDELVNHILGKRPRSEEVESAEYIVEDSSKKLKAKVSLIGRRLLEYKYTEFDHENAVERLGAPKGLAQFCSDLEAYPKVECSDHSETHCERLYSNILNNLDPIKPHQNFHLIINGQHKLARISKVKWEPVFGFTYTEIERPKNPNIIEYKTGRYQLSKEIQSNILGLRGDNHSVSLDQIKECIERSHKKLMREVGGEYKRFDYYFKLADSAKVLNVVFEYYPKIQTDMKNPLFNVITAYFPEPSILKHRSHNGNLDWVNSLPKIKSE